IEVLLLERGRVGGHRSLLVFDPFCGRRIAALGSSSRKQRGDPIGVPDDVLLEVGDLPYDVVGHLAELLCEFDSHLSVLRGTSPSRRGLQSSREGRGACRGGAEPPRW